MRSADTTYPQRMDMNYAAVISRHYVCVKIMRGRV